MDSSRLVRVAGPLIMLTLSLVVAAGIGEVALRLLRPQVFPTIPAGLFTDREDGFRMLTPGFSGTISRAEFSTPVTIGDFGVRGTGPAERTERTFRVLSLGDSQTFGFGVLDQETYPVHLRELLAAQLPEHEVEVINAGVPGYGTVDELIWLRDRGAEVRPDLILVQFLSVNDFKINRISEHAGPILAADSGQRPHRVAGPAVPEAAAPASVTRPAAGHADTAPRRPSIGARIVGAVHAAKKRSHLATLVSETASYVGMRAGLLGGVDAMWGEDFTPEDSVRTHRLMVLLAREAQRLDVPIVIVYTTGKAQVIAGDDADLRSAAVIRAAAAEAGVPWIDMRAELRRRPDRQALYFVRDGHWTAQGQRAVAEVLAEQLTALGLVPREPRG